MVALHRSAIVGGLALSVWASAARAQESAVWENLSLGDAGAPALQHAGATFYGSQHRVVMFGGWDNDVFEQRNALWAWDGSTWSQLCQMGACVPTRPPVRNGPALAYDPVRDRLVVFGGLGAGLLNDTWEFDGQAWARQCMSAPCTTNVPSARLLAGMVFDAGRQRVVLFGGSAPNQDPDCYGDMWEWDGVVWTPLHPPTSPPLRESFGFAYDSARGREVLFGGRPCTGSTATPLADTWEFDGTTWVEAPAGGPAPRYLTAMAFDSKRGRTVLYGGRTGDSADQEDTWEWDGSGWTSIGVTGPAGRSMCMMAFDPERGRTVLFGGQMGIATIAADTWEYHTRGRSCASASTCDTGHCVSGVCCEEACGGGCASCAADGHPPGVCVPITAGQTATCSGARHCGPDGTCVAQDGQPCESGAECASQSCLGGVCCKTATCGNFGCDQAGDCKVACSGDQDCATGFACSAEGDCVPVPQAGCADLFTVRLTDGEEQDCRPYRCSLEGTCRKTCSSALDCDDESDCSASGACVPRRAAQSAPARLWGCTASAAACGPDGSTVGLALMLACAAASRLRRNGGRE